VRLTAEVHVLDDVEVVAQSEILVDDLDPELCRLLGAVDRHLAPLKEGFPLVHRVNPRDALDQRRLAGAVVADESHDLAVTDLEVDVAERLNRAERLRDAAELEEWCVGHPCDGWVAGVEAPGGRLHADAFPTCSTACTCRCRSRCA